MGTENRQRNERLTIRFTKEEINEIKDLADQCGVSPSAYLRSLGLGYTPKSNLDTQAIRHLANLHGDLGRVGGLLKLWLTDDTERNRTKELNIRDVVKKILDLQAEIRETAERI